MHVCVFFLINNARLHNVACLHNSYCTLTITVHSYIPGPQKFLFFSKKLNLMYKNRLIECLWWVYTLRKDIQLLSMMCRTVFMSESMKSTTWRTCPVIQSLSVPDELDESLPISILMSSTMSSCNPSPFHVSPHNLIASMVWRPCHFGFNQP